MTKAAYSPSSPYFQTKSFGNFLDVMVNRPVTPNADDVLYEIDKVYEYRPDMLAFDLYGNSSLWWVFAKRNPNALKDPLFDFRAGVQIYIPKKSTLQQDLGV
jgi:alpha-L-fucosidase